ncbi:MAG: YbbR-like domain-containing protein [Sporolactobacillus sp.]
MDKLLRKNWLVKIISFLIALMLYAVVSAGESPSSSPSNIAVSPTQETTLTEKLNVLYDSDKYVVSGAPQTVTIHVSGSSNLILKARLMTKSAYIDLKGMKPGTFDARVQTKGFPSDLTIKPSPKTVRIRLQKKTSKELPVAIDLLNKNKLGDGFIADDPTIFPKNVTVTGGADTIDSIAFVKGVVNVRGATGNVNQSVVLHAYNNNGDQLDVTLQPATVRVQIPINKLSKDLPLQGATTGSPASGYSVSSIDLSQQQATVTAADAATLKSITAIPPLSVSASGLKSDKTFTVDVPLPQGASKVSPTKVKVTVHIDPSAAPASADSSSDSSSESSSSSSDSSPSDVTKKFNAIPVNIVGLKDNQQASFDAGGSVDVTVTGDPSDVNSLSASDIQAQVDLSNMDSGDHNVSVAVKVPNGLSGKSNPKTVGISIS